MNSCRNIIWCGPRSTISHNTSLRVKPQSHRIVRFFDLTIGCDLVSYDGNVYCDLLLLSHALVYSLRLVVGNMLICMIIYACILSGQQ